MYSGNQQRGGFQPRNNYNNNNSGKLFSKILYYYYLKFRLLFVFIIFNENKNI